MKKNMIFAICLSIIIGFTILGAFVYYGLINLKTQQTTTRYQMITHGDTVVVFDQETGDYWTKYIPQNEGPTDWEIDKTPIK